MAPTIERIGHSARLGEGPHWDSDTQSLYFIDYFRKALHRYVPATKQLTTAVIEGKTYFFCVGVIICIPIPSVHVIWFLFSKFYYRREVSIFHIMYDEVIMKKIYNNKSYSVRTALIFLLIKWLSCLVKSTINLLQFMLLFLYFIFLNFLWYHRYN